MKLHWGVLGTGSIAAKVVEVGLQKAGPDHEVIAVGSRTLESAKQFAEKRGIKKYYGSYEEVNAVYLPLPTTLHKEWTIKAAQAKKHVLCEKPLAANSQDAEEMLQVCKDNNVLLMDGTFWVHHNRFNEIASKYLTQDTFTSVHASFCWPGVNPKNIRCNPSLEPTGSLGDMAWYSCGVSLWAFQWELPQKVIGYVNKRGPNDCILDIHGMLFFAENKVAHIEASYDSAFEQTVQVSSKSTTIRIDDFVLPFGATSLFSEHHAVTDVAEYKVIKFPGVGTTHKCAPCVEEVQMIVDFGKAVNGEDKYRWVGNAIKTMKVLDALLESAKSGNVVSLQ